MCRRTRRAPGSTTFPSATTFRARPTTRRRTRSRSTIPKVSGSAGTRCNGTLTARLLYIDSSSSYGLVEPNNAAIALSGTWNADVINSTHTVVVGQLMPTRLPLTNFKNANGTSLAAAASTNDFGISVSLGTSEFLLSEAANSNTKTDFALAEFVLPSYYAAGRNLTVAVNCNYTVGGGTVGTHTLAVAAYVNAANGTQSSNICTTGALALPSSNSALNFTINGSSLVPGSYLTLLFTLVIQDTGGSNITAQINSTQLSY